MRISDWSSDVCSSDLLKIGFTPLREALMRLSSEGLVLAEEQRGFRVAPATLADLEDIMTSRAEIEALALQRAIRLGGDDWEARIVAAFHQIGSASCRERVCQYV